MRIAVTGGAGYIGSTLVRDLLREGFEVVSIDDQSIGSYRYLESKVVGGQLLVGDVRSSNDLDDALKSVDGVAHLAAIPGLTRCDDEPEEAISINVYGTRQVMEAVKRNRISRVVNCSSAAVYGKPDSVPVTESHDCKPLNLYGVTKLASEKVVDMYHANFNIETVNLRFGNVYGVGLYSNWETVIPKFVKQALEEKPLTVYGDGSSSRDFVHVEDICQALKLSLTMNGVGGQVFNVGSEPTTIGEIAKIVSDEVASVTGKKVNISYSPPRLGETKEFSYSLTKIIHMLGYKPAWKLRNGIRQLIEYKLNEEA